MEHQLKNFMIIIQVRTHTQYPESHSLIPCHSITPTNQAPRSHDPSRLPAAVAMLRLLVLILELRSKHSTRDRAHDTVSTKLIATEVAGRTTSHGAHQTSIALGLCVGIGAAVLLLAGLSVGVLRLSLGVLVLWICALLGKLVLRLLSGVCTLLLLAILPGGFVRHWLLM